MVGIWKPDCPREFTSSGIPNVDQTPVIANTEGENGEENEIPPGAYQLLPSDMLQGLNEEVTASDDSTEDEDSDEFEETDNSPVNENSEPVRHLEGVTGWERQEIQVNSDEIRSLMSNFSLPQSSIPDWASSIPESSFTEFIQSKFKTPGDTPASNVT